MTRTQTIVPIKEWAYHNPRTPHTTLKRLIYQFIKTNKPRAAHDMNPDDVFIAVDGSELIWQPEHAPNPARIQFTDHDKQFNYTIACMIAPFTPDEEWLSRNRRSNTDEWLAGRDLLQFVTGSMPTANGLSRASALEILGPTISFSWRKTVAALTVGAILAGAAFVGWKMARDNGATVEAPQSAPQSASVEEYVPYVGGAMPLLVGKTESEARTVAEGLGLAVTVEYVNTPLASPGLVVSHSPRAGVVLDGVSSVVLTVRQDGERSIPSLVGFLVADVEQVLKSAGVMVDVAYVDVAKPEGVVVEQGGVVGGRVGLSVSSGYTIVPAFVGGSLEEVTRAIEAQKFTVTIKHVETPDKTKDNVVLGVPDADTRQPYASHITVEVGKYVAPPQPDTTQSGAGDQPQSVTQPQQQNI